MPVAPPAMPPRLSTRLAVAGKSSAPRRRSGSRPKTSSPRERFGKAPACLGIAERRWSPVHRNLLRGARRLQPGSLDVEALPNNDDIERDINTIEPSRDEGTHSATDDPPAWAPFARGRDAWHILLQRIVRQNIVIRGCRRPCCAVPGSAHLQFILCNCHIRFLRKLTAPRTAGKIRS